MNSITAKELKNQTGKVLRRVGAGEKVLITKRGKPLAVLSPVEEGQLKPPGVRSYEDAWVDIEKKLKRTRPRFKTWEEAMKATRWRS